MYIIFIFPIMIITNILVIAFGYKLKEIFVHYLGTYFIFTALLDYMFSYCIFWKGDRYLSYFSQFEKEKHQNQKVWDIMTALYSIMVAVVWFVTLINT